MTAQPMATSSRAKIWIEVETPLTRGKYTSEIIRIRISGRYSGPVLRTYYIRRALR